MKKKTFGLLACICLFCGSLSAQTIFELNYRSPGNPPVSALLIKYSSGTGYARISYTDTVLNTPVILNLDLEEADYFNSKGEKDSTLMVVRSVNPVSVATGKTSSYLPETYLFRLDPDAGIFIPWKLVSKPNSATENFTEFTSLPNALGTNKLIPLLPTYFLPTEPVVKAFQELGAQTRGGKRKTVGDDTSMYVIIVADELDKTISAGVSKDVKLITEMYSAVSFQLGFSDFNLITVSKDQFTKKGVEDALRSLKPGPNDIVIFHYTGHGFNDKQPKHPYPNMFLRTDKDHWEVGLLPTFTLSIEEVYQAIVKKGARLNLVFADCCNSTWDSIPAVTAGRLDRSVTRGTQVLNYDKCKALFLDTRASILVASAQKGEISRTGRDGSYFTYSFTKSFSESMGLLDPHPTLSWDELLDMTKAKNSFYINNRCVPKAEEKIAKCLMTPIVSIDKNIKPRVKPKPTPPHS